MESPLRLSTQGARFYSVIGLGFGDCGKGRFVDELCPRLAAHTVVRYNGGAQAGHTVCRPDGRHHIFSQFSAGTWRGATTLLAAPLVVHPTGLLREAEVLRQLGCDDVLARLLIDARCRITTPFLQAAGRLRELARHPAPHGTCGVGFGETVRLSLEKPALTVTYADLLDPKRCRAKLEDQRLELRRSLLQLDPGPPTADPRAVQEWRCLDQADLGERWLENIPPLVDKSPPRDPEWLRPFLLRPGGVIFEGAQGLLLDEDFGFHPHTTWSRVGPAAVATVLSDLGIEAPICHWGVLRTYLTRHGAGPFPTWDPMLDHLVEPHNHDAGWQGPFRRGHPDQVLLWSALTVAPEIEGLLVSHLDVVATSGPALRWCEGYSWPGLGLIHQLEELTPQIPPSLDRQEHWSRLLTCAIPCYSPEPTTSAATWLAQARERSQRPILLASEGPLPGQVTGLLNC